MEGQVVTWTLLSVILAFIESFNIDLYFFKEMSKAMKLDFNLK